MRAICAAALLACASLWGCSDDDPVASADAVVAADRAAPDAAPSQPDAAPDAMASGSCTNASQCPNGWHCLYWTAGCGELGRCEPSLPPVDACVGCTRHCRCNGGSGVTVDEYATQPFVNQGYCAGDGPDGGAGD